jgi:hypothetical protein
LCNSSSPRDAVPATTLYRASKMRARTRRRPRSILDRDRNP